MLTQKYKYKVKFSGMCKKRSERDSFYNISLCLKSTKTFTLAPFPVHRHHRSGDNGALCGSHSIQYYSVTVIATELRNMMSSQLLVRTTKEYLRMDRSTIRLKPEGKFRFGEAQ